MVLEKGPFWDPDRDWVSDEAGSHHIYWTDKRIIGGEDPVELGKNNSGHGVGGSMVHYAGYTPRFHPSDFETETLDGVGKDWPITYWDLKRHYERLEHELPVAGQDWPWGDPHTYPHGPHPLSAALARVAGRARLRHRDARRAGGHRQRHVRQQAALHLPRLLPAGCKVNAKASPLVTHVPDAIEHGAEIRADSMVTRIETDGGPLHRRHVRARGGRERFQRAAAVAVAGYSIETPRLHAQLRPLRERERPGGPLHHGPGRAAGGRPLPGAMHMYKGPPPEVSSEQFYETDESRGFARGFSIQTVGPLPIGWAEHVLAEGHWGRRCASTCATTTTGACSGCCASCCRMPENRVTLADEQDAYGMPIARFDYTQSKTTTTTSRSPRRSCTRSGSTPTRRTSLRSTATPISSAAAGWASPEDSVCDSDHRVWGVAEPLPRRRQRDADPGQREPRAHDHGLASRLAERLDRKRVARPRVAAAA